MIVSILLGLRYKGNIGSCIRNGNLLGIKTIITKPTHEMFEKELDKSLEMKSLEKIYSNNKFINYIILFLLHYLTVIFNINNEKLKNYYPNPFNSKGEYTKKFIKETIRFSMQENCILDNKNIVFDKRDIKEILLEYSRLGFKILFVENYDEFPKINLYDYKFNKKCNYVLVFGSENNGIPTSLIKEINTELNDGLQIFIKTTQNKSLNVSVVNGIVLSYASF